MLLILVLLVWNLAEVISIYRMFKKKNLLFDDRFTKTMCMAITTISSVALSLYLELLIPENQMSSFFLPILVGVFIGWRFGSIIKAPATLNGIYNGAMGGMMGMMLGAVLQNPALCNIPIDSDSLIATNMYVITVFIALLHTIVSSFIRYSIKV
ncbi:hypothetical protein FITA111629_03280 [Filibacter tadaridae]|uniref:Uncharacterized protein n=2 Tax=Filibacter tadaridae TaxID=2483811 RepID=A0A3P5X9D5_9BACL|nr:hypothetical protein FILTAD_01574 [Filibacter tadaridae]